MGASWSFDVKASSRAAAVAELERRAQACSLPRVAADHFIGVLRGENYWHGGFGQNPDGALRIAGSGSMVGDGPSVFLETGALEYAESFAVRRAASAAPEARC